MILTIRRITIRRRDLDCGNYYIQVSGVGAGGEGEYDLAWKVSETSMEMDS